MAIEGNEFSDFQPWCSVAVYECSRWLDTSGYDIIPQVNGMSLPGHLHTAPNVSDPLKFRDVILMAADLRVSRQRRSVAMYLLDGWTWWM